MNKKRTIKFLAITFLAGMAFSACKKSTNEATMHDKFVGSWKCKQTVQDVNNNGVQDATDLTSNLDSFLIVMKLNSDGSGTLTSVISGSTGSSFKWALANNDTYFNITDSGSTTFNTSFITQAPGTTFVMKDTTGGIVQWETFSK